MLTVNLDFILFLVAVQVNVDFMWGWIAVIINFVPYFWFSIIVFITKFKFDWYYIINGLDLISNKIVKLLQKDLASLTDYYIPKKALQN